MNLTRPLATIALALSVVVLADRARVIAFRWEHEKRTIRELAALPNENDRIAIFAQACKPYLLDKENDQ